MRKIFIAVGLFIFIFVAAYSLWQFYQTAKHDAVLEKLSHFDRHTISDDHLALYWIYAKHDPLFAIPGTDLEKMKQNLELLDSLLLSVTDTYTAEEKALIDNSLYPTDFLLKLVELETARESFITAPEHDRANAYHQQLLATMAEYDASLQRMIDTLYSLTPNTIGFLAGTTSAPLIAERLSAVKTATDDMVELENNRFECLDRFQESCAFLDRQTITAAPSKDPGPLVITPEIWGNKDALDALYTKNTASSTLIALNESHCYPQEDPVIYAYWEEINYLLPNVPFIRATPVNDLFLQDLEASADHAYYRSWRDAGLDYSIQPMNLYFCIDGGIEYQKLATIKMIYELAANLERPSTSIVPDYISAVFDTIPDASHNLLSESAVNDYLNLLSKLFQDHNELELISHLGQENYDQLRNIHLLWHAKTADLDQLINTANYMTETNRGVLDIVDIPLEPLYMTRSYISLLFQLGNVTVNQAKTTLISAPHLQSLDSFKIVSGNQLFPTAADKEDLKAMLIENDRLLINSIPKDQPVDEIVP